MSIKVMSAVWEHSQSKGSALLLLLAIADHAHDDGDGAFPSVPHLAKKIRMEERTVQLLTKQLIKARELSVRNAEGPGRTNVYKVLIENLKNGEKISPSTVKSFHLDGEKSGVLDGEKSGIAYKEESSAEESSVKAAAGKAIAAAAKIQTEPHDSHHTFADVERFVRATKRHSRNPGGLARALYRSGEEDELIATWLNTEKTMQARQPNTRTKEEIEEVLRKIEAYRQSSLPDYLQMERT